jgi:hypothetical protein
VPGAWLMGSIVFPVGVLIWHAFITRHATGKGPSPALGASAVLLVPVMWVGVAAIWRAEVSGEARGAAAHHDGRGADRLAAFYGRGQRGARARARCAMRAGLPGTGSAGRSRALCWTPTAISRAPRGRSIPGRASPTRCRGPRSPAWTRRSPR